MNKTSIQKRIREKKQVELKFLKVLKEPVPKENKKAIMDKTRKAVGNLLNV